MTKKHFIKFAAIIKEYVDQGDLEIAKAIYHTVLTVNDNTRFDVVRFTKACGL